MCHGNLVVLSPVKTAPLVHKGQSIKLTQVHLHTLEISCLGLGIGIGIYHPSIGTMAGNTHTKFLDEVSQLVQYFITNHQNLVLLCDVNIHTQDLTHPDLLECLAS